MYHELMPEGGRLGVAKEWRHHEEMFEEVEEEEREEEEEEGVFILQKEELEGSH